MRTIQTDRWYGLLKNTIPIVRDPLTQKQKDKIFVESALSEVLKEYYQLMIERNIYEVSVNKASKWILFISSMYLITVWILAYILWM